MKHLFIALACIGTVTAFAGAPVASVTTNAVPKQKPSPEEFRKILETARMKKTGGFVRKEGSASGCFVVLNGQKKVAAKEIAAALGTLDRQVKVQTKLVEGTGIDAANVREKIRAAGGTVGLAVVESQSLPSILAAPETGWAIVNVTALSAGADDKTLATRLRKEILRGFAFVAGGCYSPFGDYLMRDIAEPKNLDVVQQEEFTIAMLQRFSQSLGRYKIKPWYETTYLKACQEGWAALPTNDYQKVIWEKCKAEANTKPTNPMRITKEKK